MKWNNLRSWLLQDIKIIGKRGFQLPTWMGAIITAGIAVLIEASRQGGSILPIPFILLIMATILSASVGGIRAGLLSAAVWAGYVIYAAMVPFGPPTLTGGVGEVSLGILVVLFVVLRQGIASDRNRHLTQALQSMNETLDEQVRSRTVELSETNARLRREIQERHSVEEELRQSEARFRRAIENAPFPIVIHAEDGEILTVNNTWTELTGYTHTDIPTVADWTERAYGERKELARAVIDKLYALDRRVDEGEFTVTTATGEERTWDFSSAPLGQLLDGRRLVISIATDATSRKQAEQALRASEALYAGIFNHSAEAIFAVNVSPDGQFTYETINPADERAIGMSVADVVGKPPRDLLPHDVATKVEHHYRAALEAGDLYTYEETLELPDGKSTWHTNLVPIHDETGQIIKLLGSRRDISESRRTEEAKREAETKSILLKEIHHRIKNNLQIISGLLYLQSRTTKDELTLKVLQESRDRIEAMALIHETLYGSANLQFIDFRSYIHRLTRNLFASYVTQGNIQLSIHIDSVYLDIDAAIPCGLIINELVSNALKHGFPDHRPGEITVKFCTSNHDPHDQKFQLVVYDNGVGIPDSVNFHTQKSLGLRLVRTLAVRQLKGKVTITRDAGVGFVITFRRKCPLI